MVTPSPELKPDDGRDDDRYRDSETGRFLPGHPSGRKHRIDLLSLCDRKAREEGIRLDVMLWEVVKGLVVEAICGDVAAAKLLFDKLTRREGDGTPGVAVQFNINAGPPVPGDLGGYVEQLRALENEERLALTVDPVARSVVEEILS